jgi:hypothetical protein
VPFFLSFIILPKIYLLNIAISITSVLLSFLQVDITISLKQTIPVVYFSLLSFLLNTQFYILNSNNNFILTIFITTYFYTWISIWFIFSYLISLQSLTYYTIKLYHHLFDWYLQSTVINTGSSKISSVSILLLFKHHTFRPTAYIFNSKICCFFLYNLFCDTISISDHIALYHDLMVNDELEKIWKETVMA